MNIPELIRRKREGLEIPAAELKEFIDGYVAGTVEEYQVSAFLMAVFFKGMAPQEAAALTRSMLDSGERFDLSDIPGPKVDKHSTGGVGDKVSLILAPLVAAAGGIVPMVSGRGLGHTGGTLDKLDAIPGYRWNLDGATFKKQLAKVGCAIIGQTDRFVPADKKLYALRDVTATVESIPLICGSILSKKVAAGTESLVMDVKCGSGAFMDSPEKARALADGLVSIGTALGMKVSALLTQMNQPLGQAIGNAIEIEESVELLRGKGPADARWITVRLCAEMCVLAGLDKTLDGATKRLEKLLDDGTALAKFREWMTAQGGDPRIADDTSILEISKETVPLLAEQSGWISSMQTRDIGVAANTLGAGRFKASDKVDLTVGLRMHKTIGDRVEKGEPILTIYHRGGRNLAEATAMLRASIKVGEQKVEKLPLLIG